jgi:hypothetical protein
MACLKIVKLRWKGTKQNKTKKQDAAEREHKEGFFITQITSKMCNIYIMLCIELPEF